MRRIVRSLLLIGTGILILALVSYRLIAPQLQGTPLIYVVGIGAFVGLAIVLRLIFRERGRD